MTPQLIVYERAPLNAPSLAKRNALQLREVRSLQQTRCAIEQAPWSIVALEVQFDNLVPTTELARWAKSRFPVALIGLPDRSVGDCWNAYLSESGVDLIFRSNLDLNLMSRLVKRQCLRSKIVAENRTPIPLRNQVWQRLPWKRHASGGRS